MALPVNNPISRYALSAHLADVSTDSTAYAVVPMRGRIVKAWSVISNAITGTDCGWALEVNGTAITGATATITQSGSAAGDVDSATPSSPNNYVNEGDYIGFNSDGASSTTTPTTFVVLIDRV